MDYTAEQYEMLERFEAGVNITTFTEDEKVIFWFLDGNKLLQAHSDIEDGLFDLSQQGKCVLESHREAILKAKQLRKGYPLVLLSFPLTPLTTY